MKTTLKKVLHGIFYVAIPFIPILAIILLGYFYEIYAKFYNFLDSIKIINDVRISDAIALLFLMLFFVFVFYGILELIIIEPVKLIIEAIKKRRKNGK